MKLIKGFLKWLLLILIGVISGLLVYVLQEMLNVSNELISRLVILFCIAFITSVFCRLMFRKAWAVFQIILVFPAVTLALFWFDKVYPGVYQFEFTQNLSKIQDVNSIQIPTIQDASQILFMLVISLPFILFFRKKKKKIVTKSSSKSRSKPGFSEKWKIFTYRVNPVNWSIGQKTKPSKKGHSQKPVRVNNHSSSLPVHISSSRKSPTNIKTGSKEKTRIISSKRKIRLPGNLFGSTVNHDVKLSGEEEKVCPYCLEEVRKGDSRGVVVCQECGTWHHEDCWTLSGSCGIAHRNEL